MASKKSRKVAPCPNIHPGCKVQIIDDSQDRPVWRTVGMCFDAPNPISAMMRKNNLTQAWVLDILGDRRMVYAD